MKKVHKSLLVLLSLLIVGNNICLSQIRIDSGYVKNKGFKIFYTIYGSGDPILFLNGGPGFSSKGYLSYAKMLSQDFMIILFDQRGTGKSKSKKYNPKIRISDMVSDIEKLRMELEINKWTVFGHSFGGQYAMYYAAFHNHNIEKLILSSTPVLTIKLDQSYLQDFKLPSIEYLTIPERVLLDKLQNQVNSESPSLDSISIYRTALNARRYVHYPRNYESVINWFLKNRRSPNCKIKYNLNSEKLIEELKNIENEVLIVHGINDFINLQSPLEHHKLFKNSTLKIFDREGHMIILDNYERYKDTITKFLSDN